MPNFFQQIELEQTCDLHISSLSQVLSLDIVYWQKRDGNEGIFIACMGLLQDRPIFYLPLCFEEHKDHTMVLWRSHQEHMKNTRNNIKTQTQEKIYIEPFGSSTLFCACFFTCLHGV